MYLERRRWKLTAVWVEKIMSLNCGYCFAMWWGIWSKNCQAVILNSILQSKSKHIHTSSMMFQSGSGFKFQVVILYPMYVRNFAFSVQHGVFRYKGGAGWSEVWSPCGCGWCQ
jgi:hypothetical protein